MSTVSVIQSRPVTTMLGGLALLVSSVSAATDISVALGHSADSTMTYRVGLQFPWQQSWFDSDIGRLSGAFPFTCW